MPWVDGARCPLCEQVVKPVRGELRACTCQRTLAGLTPEGALHVAGPEGVERVPVHVPYREQLKLPFLAFVAALLFASCGGSHCPAKAATSSPTTSGGDRTCEVRR